MNSTEEIREALRALDSIAGISSDWSLESDSIVFDTTFPAGSEEGGTSWLFQAALAAREISYDFNNINQSLHSGWENVASFMERIDHQLRLEGHELYEAVAKFANITTENEEQINSSITKANEEAEQILTELGLN